MRKLLSMIKLIVTGGDDSHQEKRIISLMDDAEIRGDIDRSSIEMIKRILEFHNRLVREVMVPRREIIAVDSKATVNEIITTIIGYGYTRVPVYSDNIDNIVGILNVKDIIKYWSTSLSEKEITSHLHKPYFIPETKRALSLLHELKQKKYHMAIVIDEYGGTSGLVTLEDLLEEIVGEILDEHDIEEEEEIVETAGGVLVDCRLEIEKVEDYFGIKFPEGRYKTLAGLILSTVKKIPVTGEVLKVAGLEIIIEAADERSIKKVKIKRYVGLEE